MREKPFFTVYPDHGAGWLDALTTLAMQYSPFGLARSFRCLWIAPS
jgi:hypothetical protein